MAWGDVDAPVGTCRNAPMDPALLAPFGRQPLLQAPALLKLVQSKFLSGESGEKAPLDLARVEEWLANAEIRGLVRVDSRNRYRLTQAGERRRRADQLGGLTVLRKSPDVTKFLSQAAAIVIAAAGGSGALYAVFKADWFFVVIGVVILAWAIFLYRVAGTMLRPVEQRLAEIKKLSPTERYRLVQEAKVAEADLPAADHP